MKDFKKGDKIIFVINGGVLSAKKGNVFTFSNWHDEEHLYWQCEEILQLGNYDHNFCVWGCEKFDPSIHKEFRIMDADELDKDYAHFVAKYGA